MTKNPDLKKLPVIDQFAKIPLDTDRLCRVIDERVYIEHLLGGRSFCEKDMSTCDQWEDPFLMFNEYINSDHRKLCLLIGCSGVGKSSFLKHQITKNEHFFRFNLNKHNETTFSVLDINIYIMNELIELFKTKFSEDCPVALYEAFNKVHGFTYHYLIEPEHKKWKNGQNYDRYYVTINLTG